jgi:hypothetical protein
LIRMTSRKQIQNLSQQQRTVANLAALTHTIDLVDVREVLTADQILLAMVDDRLIELSQIINRLKISSPIPGKTLSYWRDNYPELTVAIEARIRAEQ